MGGDVGPAFDPQPFDSFNIETQLIVRGGITNSGITVWVLECKLIMRTGL